MNHKKINAITDGAICTALSVLFLIMALYIPPFATVAVMVAGLPLVFLAVRRGLKVTLVATAASVLVLAIIAGNVLSALILGMVNLLPGVMIGYGISRRKSFVATVFLSAFTVLTGLLVQLCLLSIAAGGNGIASLIDSAMAASREMITAMGNADPQIAKTMNQTLAVAKEMLLLYLPSALIGISAVLGYGAVAIAVFMLRRIQKVKVEYIPFFMMYAPRAICYLSLFLSLGVLLIQEVTVYTAAFKNLAFLTDCFIGVCGFSLIDDKFRRKISSGYVRTGIYAAVIFVAFPVIGVIAEVLMFLGMLDGLFGFRRFRKVGEGNGENK